MSSCHHRTICGLFAALALSACTHAAAGQLQSLRVQNVSTAPRYVVVTNASGLAPQAFTAEAWVQPFGAGFGQTNDTFGSHILSLGAPNAGNTGPWAWVVRWSPVTRKFNAILVPTSGNTSDGVTVIGNAVVPIGQAAHIAITFDGSVFRLIVDGVIDAQAPVPFASPRCCVPEFRIGAAESTSGFTRRSDALIDDVRIWDRAKTAAEISANRFCEPTGSEAGLVAAWTFVNGSLADITGNGHNGAAVGAVTFPTQLNVLGSSPRITGPLSANICPTGSAELSFTVTGSVPLTSEWQWRPQGGSVWVAVAEGVNSHPEEGEPSFFATGTGTGTLAVSSTGASFVTLQQPREFRVYANNSCADATSTIATLSICVGDFNCDSGVDGDDVIAFFGVWDAGELAADVTGDGGVDGDDVIAFFGAWDGGC
jgi:hypothetical protein